jgi:hypothetical protein
MIAQRIGLRPLSQCDSGCVGVQEHRGIVAQLGGDVSNRCLTTREQCGCGVVAAQVAACVFHTGTFGPTPPSATEFRRFDDSPDLVGEYRVRVLSRRAGCEALCGLRLPLGLEGIYFE